MASRSRYQQLKGLRNSAKALRQGAWESLDSENQNKFAGTPLLGTDAVEDQQSSSQLNEIVINIPPEWSSLVDKTNQFAQEISTKLIELKNLHKKHILPGFSDKVNEGKHIEQLSRSITLLIRQCHANITKIGELPDVGRDRAEEARLRANARMGLAMKLQELSFEFKRIQSDYLKLLRAQEERQPASSAAFNLSEEEKRRLAVALSDDNYERDANSNDNNDGNIFSMLTQDQLLLQQQSISTERQQKERHKAIKELIQSVIDLSEMVRQCHDLVIEQGTILDRIDHNIEIAESNVRKGLEDLIATERREQRGIIAACINLEMLIICFLAAVLFLKLIIKYLSSK